MRRQWWYHIIIVMALWGGDNNTITFGQTSPVGPRTSQIKPNSEATLSNNPDQAPPAKPSSPSTDQQSTAEIRLSSETKRTQRILDQFIRKLNTSQSFSCHIHQVENIAQDNIQLKAQKTVTLIFRRPDRLAFLNPGRTSLWSDPSGVVMFNALTWQSAANDATPNRKLWDSPESLSAIEDIPLLNAILSNRQWKLLKTLPIEWKQLDDQLLDGVNCRHITFTLEQIPFHLWFQAEGEKSLCQIAAEKAIPASDNPGGGPITLSAIWKFDDWQYDIALDDALFRANIPTDTKPQNQHKLVGQPAPQFTAPIFKQGGVFDLSQHRNKQIVILDFWATWCGPCRQGLPVLDRLAQMWDKDSVAVYAVNISDRDSLNQIQQFILKNQLQLPVLIGHNPEISRKYQVSGIPQTVIIGKNGIVQQVYVGLAQNMDELLQKQVARLLKKGESEGNTTALKADVTCSAAGFSTQEPGQPAKFWCEISNAGPDAIFADRLALNLKLSDHLEVSHVIDKPIAKGEKLRYEIPVEKWCFTFSPYAKGQMELILDPFETLEDPDRENNRYAAAWPAKSK